MRIRAESWGQLKVVGYTPDGVEFHHCFVELIETGDVGDAGGGLGSIRVRAAVRLTQHV